MKNRIDEKTSRTAEMTCSFRAASFFEKDPCLKSNDYIAPQLLPRIMLPMVKSRTVRKVFMNTFAPQGIYEYVIARTKYIDDSISEAVQNGFTQVLLLGAGFDSRAIRFHALNPETVFFEVDTEIIQAAKESQLQKRNISLPKTCRFVPVNFNRENAADKLIQYGFQKGQQTLVILEGLLMYLTGDVAAETFRMIREFAGKKSRIVCDFIYQSVLRKENLFYGGQDIYTRVNKYGEAWKFGIEKTEIENYFQNQGFSVSEVADEDFLRKKYFNNDDSYRINGTHCIVRLEVK